MVERRSSAESESSGASALDRALRILEACARTDRSSTITDISRATGIPKSSVHRLCWKMVNLGALSPTENGFTLGMRVVALSGATPWLRFLRTEAAPLLHSLSTATGLVGDLALLAGTQALVVDEVFASTREMPKEIGRRLPLHATAVGKALLMQRTRAGLDQIVGRIPLEAFTPATVTDLDELWDQLARAAARGYVVSRGEWKPGRFGVASPILSNGRAVASIGLIGLTVTSSIDGVGESVASAAAELSARLRA